MSPRTLIALLVLIGLQPPCVRAQDPPAPDRQARAAWLKKHATALRSIGQKVVPEFGP
jgi:hypothetical protein